MSRYIDADAYIEYCNEHWIPLNVDAVNVQPTTDVVEVVRGEWVEAYEIYRQQISWWECSVCRYGVSWKPNYCPNCGADMRGGTE